MLGRKRPKETAVLTKYTFRFSIPEGSKMLIDSEFGRDVEIRLNADTPEEAQSKAERMAARMSELLSSGHTVTVAVVQNGG
jgi:hypothetical protein